MRQSETSESLSIINQTSKEKDNFKGKEKIDSWIDDIIKQHKKRNFKKTIYKGIFNYFL